MTFEKLDEHITKMCEGKKLVLMIDEVDKISNNRIFTHFLGVLRDKFLSRQDDMDYTFHSVILVGVYDIKNIKLKMIDEGTYIPTITENKIFNSPWNIAVDFNVDMSFNSQEISTMLVEYEADHQTGMDIMEIAEEIQRFTGGYPFLVSRICQHINENLNKEWSLNGVKKAMKLLLKEKNVLFDDLFKNLKNNSDLYDLIYDVLIRGRKRSFVIDDTTIELADRYGYIKEENNRIRISNKIFEIRICNFFISQDEKVNPEPVNDHLFNIRFSQRKK